MHPTPCTPRLSDRVPRRAQGVRPFFLDLQFRAHPKLFEFPSEMIYGGRLRSGVPPHARAAPRGFAWPRLAVPLAFVETGGYRAGCAESAESESTRNAGEAARLIELLKGVLSAGELSPAQVGIITPYSAQVRLLRQLWRDTCREATPKKGAPPPADAAAAALAAACAEPRLLEIASVDNFQGREKAAALSSRTLSLSLATPAHRATAPHPAPSAHLATAPSPLLHPLSRSSSSSRRCAPTCAAPWASSRIGAASTSCSLVRGVG